MATKIQPNLFVITRFDNASYVDALSPTNNIWSSERRFSLASEWLEKSSTQVRDVTDQPLTFTDNVKSELMEIVRKGDVARAVLRKFGVNNPSTRDVHWATMGEIGRVLAKRARASYLHHDVLGIATSAKKREGWHIFNARKGIAYRPMVHNDVLSLPIGTHIGVYSDIVFTITIDAKYVHVALNGMTWKTRR